MTKEDLLQKKSELIKAGDEILAKAKDENRFELQGDENKKFDDIHDELGKVNSFLDKLTKQESYAASEGRRSEPVASTENRNRAASRGVPTGADHDLALRGWLLNSDEERHMGAAKRLGLNINSKDIVLQLPPALRSLSKSDVEAWEKRAPMGVASGAIGLYASPDSPMGALEKALLAFGGMRQVARVIRTASGTDLPIPTNDDTSNKGALLAENTQVSEVDATFGQLVLNSFKYSSKLVLVARELLEDSAINVPELIGSLLGDRLGRIQNDHFTVGDASSKPNGLVTAATSSSITTASATTISYDNIIDLIHKVDPAYRPQSSFMFHDGGLKIIKKVKIAQFSGDTAGVPLWQPSLVAGQPDTIAGYPFVVNQSVVTPGAGTKSFVFGALGKYIIRDVNDVRLVRMDERYADYDQVGFTAFMRSDGDLLDAGTHPVYYATQGS